MTDAAKTRPTGVSVEDYLAGIADAARVADCRALMRMMGRLTGTQPVMWGPSMIGFDRYHYRYESGREGDSFLMGFSSRKAELAIYVVAGFEGAESILAKLGKHRTAKACLYVKRLSDVDPAALEALLARSAAEIRRRYPAAGG